jgi:hypothetical protein
VASALIAVDIRHVLLSVLSAIALSLVIFTFHKRGRYNGY